MGLAEQIKAGAQLQRSSVTIITDDKTSGSVALGASYALLGVSTTVPCRFRLYDNLASLNDLGETSRTFGNTNISASVALVGDLSMSSANTFYTVDPIMYGVLETGSNKLAYYRVNEAASFPTITITRYLLEDISVPASIGTSYEIDNRRSFSIKTGSFAYNAMTSGTLSTANIPQTYLLVSASVQNANNIVRLRLYSTSTPLYDEVEKARQFDKEPTGSIPLIVDAYISGNQATYFAPKIIGANLQGVNTNLSKLVGDFEAMAGENELYYIMENKRNATTIVTASVHLYALED